MTDINVSALSEASKVAVSIQSAVSSGAHSAVDAIIETVEHSNVVENAEAIGESLKSNLIEWSQWTPLTEWPSWELLVEWAKSSKDSLKDLSCSSVPSLNFTELANLPKSITSFTKLPQLKEAIVTSKWTNATYTLDEAASKIPHALAKIPLVHPEIISNTILVSICFICVYLGATYSLTKPANAKEPNTDVESPYYHPSDNDHIESHIRNGGDLHRVTNANPETIGMASVLSMPFIASGALWLINYGLRTWNVNDVNWAMNYYVHALSHYAVFSNTQAVLGAGARKFGWFPRYRLCLARDVDNYPLGRLQRISDDEQILSELNKTFKSDIESDAWLKKWSSYANSHLKFWQPNVFESSTKGYNLIFDLRSVVSLPTAYLVGKTFKALNPYLNPSYAQQGTNWLVLNTISVNLAIGGIRQLHVPSFKLAYLLLGGLIVYDTVFVFKSSMMMEAATKLNVPIKLLIPRGVADDKIYMSILGLGDIVVPGTFIRLCNQFDYFKYYKNGEAFHIARPVKRVYFFTAIASYIFGLVATVTALNVYQLTQPALLYIVPSLLISNFAVSRYLGDNIWSYDGKFPEFVEADYDDEDDKDYALDQEGAAQEEFDAWVDRVELKRQGDAGDIAKEIEEIEELIESIEDPDTDMDVVIAWESDEDDDTYVIGAEEEFSEEEEEDEDAVNLLEEIELMMKDRSRTATEWYSEDEE